MVLKVSPDVVDIILFCFLFVVCICICSAGYVELPIVLLYVLRCLVYHMLSKPRRNSRFLRRVIACISYTLMLGVSHVEVLLLGLLVVSDSMQLYF